MAQVKRGVGESLIPLFSHPTLHFGKVAITLRRCDAIVGYWGQSGLWQAIRHRIYEFTTWQAKHGFSLGETDVFYSAHALHIPVR
jgi:hypothetical protein